MICQKSYRLFLCPKLCPQSFYHVVGQFCLAKFFASLKETPENGIKKPSAKPGTKGRWPKGKANRVPRVKVLNYLMKVALFFHFERDILAVNHYLTLTTKSFREISWGLEKEVKPLQFHLF